jgi:hypothetical protein
LAGLVKRALTSNEGWVCLTTLAAATGQREAAVRLGLDWLVEKGHIVILEGEGDEIRVAQGPGTPGGDVKGAAVRLQALLAETAAYRVHLTRAPSETLLGS